MHTLRLQLRFVLSEICLSWLGLSGTRRLSPVLTCHKILAFRLVIIVRHAQDQQAREAGCRAWWMTLQACNWRLEDV
jgi:hypothetical protein